MYIVSGFVVLPTAIPKRAVPGVPIVPRLGPSLPVASTAIVPAIIALLIAKEPLSVSVLDPPPKERLIMSIFCFTASSIAAIIPELEPLPYAPNTRYIYRSTFGAIPFIPYLFAPIAAIVPAT